MQSSSVCRVVVSGEDLIAREGIRSIVSYLPEVEVVGMAERPEILSSAILDATPDAVLLGFPSEPQRNGMVDSALELRKDHPDLALIILAYEIGGNAPFHLLREWSAGFAYLVRKNLVEPRQLLEAIHSERRAALNRRHTRRRRVQPLRAKS